jgi:hypothetical protein
VHRGLCSRGYSMDGSAQRYIEEFGDADEQPVYQPGDTLLPAVADLALGKPWRRVGSLSQANRTRGGIRGPAPRASGQALPALQASPDRTSEVYFETEVSRYRHRPGDYELEVVRAYPYELDGWDDLSMEF